MNFITESINKLQIIFFFFLKKVILINFRNKNFAIMAMRIRPNASWT